MKKPIIKPIVEAMKPAPKKVPAPQTVQVPIRPAELDQDSGGRYSPTHTYPQT